MGRKKKSHEHSIAVYLSKGIVELHSTELFAVLELLTASKGYNGAGVVPLDAGHRTHVRLKKNRS